jgi:hypothetical protein
VYLFAQVSERENRPVEPNGSAAAVAAMINAGVASEAKRKHHDDQIEPFKDVKRVSGLLYFFSILYKFKSMGIREK